jgi:hypothetical protein
MPAMIAKAKFQGGMTMPTDELGRFEEVRRPLGG